MRRFYVQPNPTVSRDISALPVARVIEWRAERKYDPTVKFRGHIDGLIVQSRGQVFPSPCTRCSEGRGPFAGCVAATSPQGKVLRGGTCGNCIWTNPVCSIRDFDTEKYSPPASTREQAHPRQRRPRNSSTKMQNEVPQLLANSPKRPNEANDSPAKVNKPSTQPKNCSQTRKVETLFSFVEVIHERALYTARRLYCSF